MHVDDQDKPEKRTLEKISLEKGENKRNTYLWRFVIVGIDTMETDSQCNKQITRMIFMIGKLSDQRIAEIESDIMKLSTNENWSDIWNIAARCTVNSGRDGIPVQVKLK